MADGVRCAMVAGNLSARGDDDDDARSHPGPPTSAAASRVGDDLLPLGDWIRHHSLRSWAVLLFLLLICVPSIALYILGPNPSASTFDHVAWIFAAYFAVAWLLLLGVIIRPEHVTRPMLVLVTAIGSPRRSRWPSRSKSACTPTRGLGAEFCVGLPEELAKAIPVLVDLLVTGSCAAGTGARDYLFLGAVSGLVFSASEVVRYFTVNGVGQFS